MAGWQADHLVAAHGAADRLLGGAADAVLVAPGGESKARRRADRRIGIAAREAQALDRHAIDVGRGRRAAAVATEVGVAEIVGKDEDEVRRHTKFARSAPLSSRAQRGI